MNGHENVTVLLLVRRVIEQAWGRPAAFRGDD
jgi:hypothetical protein